MLLWSCVWLDWGFLLARLKCLHLSLTTLNHWLLGNRVSTCYGQLRISSNCFFFTLLIYRLTTSRINNLFYLLWLFFLLILIKVWISSIVWLGFLQNQILMGSIRQALIYHLIFNILNHFLLSKSLLSKSRRGILFNWVFVYILHAIPLA